MSWTYFSHTKSSVLVCICTVTSKSPTEQCSYFNMTAKSDCFKFSKLLVLLDYLYSLKILIDYTFIFILWEISVTYNFEHIKSLKINTKTFDRPYYAYDLILFINTWSTTLVHKSIILVPILSQINRIHTIPSYVSRIHFNIVHSPTS
jgi:hypothetical protein